MKPNLHQNFLQNFRPFLAATKNNLLIILSLSVAALSLFSCGEPAGHPDKTGTDIFAIYEHLRPIVAKNLNVPLEAVTLGANLRKDLGAEDYELDTICLGLDKVFDVSLDLIEFRNLETVGAMVDYIRLHKRPKPVKVEASETTILNPTGK